MKSGSKSESSNKSLISAIDFKGNYKSQKNIKAKDHPIWKTQTSISIAFVINPQIHCMHVNGLILKLPYEEDGVTIWKRRSRFCGWLIQLMSWMGLQDTFHKFWMAPCFSDRLKHWGKINQSFWYDWYTDKWWISS